ncbi:4-hydroxy-tetrahydrodipicolinate synthase [Vogesella sp. LYT5W]|uniref:4-hydroxy-tetrahydrodipicolinate synthase n=1 Tax=Vogesella margarita TaxID=2984199 RepID=A0ABT5IM70_9NEIS|nr:4-hydroxy-tetrahydrodipicolinate synthase [Vogesella margarita]MDC7713649.1 4-hydroxy-tetrahydrodipicolinate synthase [Vogesella margarita]
MELKGIIPALVTPFDQNGDIDFKTLEKLVEYQLARGVHGFVPLGSTGEYYAMTAAERADVLRCVKEVVGDRALLIAGTNSGSTRDVIANTETAKKMGYDAVLLAPPYYALPTQEELIAHYDAVLDAVDVELVLYNYPPRVGVEVGFETMDAFADNPRVIAIKESSGNLLRAIEINKRYGDKYQLSCGSDDQALDFFMWGATSWICGPANFMIDPVVSFYNKFNAGDLLGAQDEMRKMFPVMASLESGKFVQKVKYGCELVGFPVGETRRPLLPLSAAEKEDLKQAFSALSE